MKRLIFTLIICALMATPVLASPTLDGVSLHLGWWAVGHPRSTHQYWDFTENVQEDGALWDYHTTIPTEKDNPSFANVLIATSASSPDPQVPPVGYTGTSFEDPEWISVLLEIENFPEPLAYKELWVQVGLTGTLVGPTALGSGSSPPYTSSFLGLEQLDNIATFGFRIFPNPAKEDVSFTILAPPGAIAVLDWIHVDTICIPAPGAIILGSIGVGLVGWLRRRKSL